MRNGKRRRRSSTWAIPSPTMRCAGSPSMGRSANLTRPRRGLSSPETVFMSVDFPAPLGPSRATIPPRSPDGTSHSTESLRTRRQAVDGQEHRGTPGRGRPRSPADRGSPTQAEASAMIAEMERQDARADGRDHAHVVFRSAARSGPGVQPRTARQHQGCFADRRRPSPRPRQHARRAASARASEAFCAGRSSVARGRRRPRVPPPGIPSASGARGTSWDFWTRADHRSRSR